MHRSIWTKLSIIFIGFIILISGSVIATANALAQQAADIAILDLANYQRVYINNIARAVLGVYTEVDQGQYYLDLIDLDRSIDGFRQAQDAIRNGGQIQTNGTRRQVLISPTTHPDSLGVLDQIETHWLRIEQAADVILTGSTNPERSRAITEIESQIPLIYQDLDTLTTLLQFEAEEDLTHLRTIQILFFISAAILLAYGYLVVKLNILNPLQTLNVATQQIAAGNFDHPITIPQKDEIGALAQSFDSMRSEVAIARQTSEAWTEDLEARVQQRTKDLEALLDINMKISSKRDVETVLHSVTNTARVLLEGEASVMCLLSESGQSLSVASISGPRTTLQRTQAQIKAGFLSNVVDEGRTIMHATCKGCPILANTELEEVVVAPMQINQKPLGAICVVETNAMKKDREIERMLTFLADTAAVALENTRLLNRAETAATLAERERIAADMHDGLAQILGFLNLKTNQAVHAIKQGKNKNAQTELNAMQPAIQEAYNTVRHWLTGLSDNSLLQNNFNAQLNEAAADFEERTNIPVNIQVESKRPITLSGEAQVQLLRIAQEGLTNIQKHANATAVNISMKREGETATLTITDNGQGFNPAEIAEDGVPHLGLKIMRGRVERVGGNLTIQSKPGHGVTIIARAPITP